MVERKKRARLSSPDRLRRKAQTQLPQQQTPHKVAWYEAVLVMLLSYLDTFFTIALYIIACIESTAYGVILIFFLVIFLYVNRQGKKKYRALLFYLLFIHLQHYIYALLWPFWSDQPDHTSNPEFNQAAHIIGLFPLYSSDLTYVGGVRVKTYSYRAGWSSWILLLCVYFEHSLF